MYKVCSAANVQIVTLRRTEHLTEDNLRAFLESKASNAASTDSSAGNTASSNPLSNLLASHGAEKVNITKVTNVSYRYYALIQTMHRVTYSILCLHVHLQEAASYNPRNITIVNYFSQEAGVRPMFEIGRPKVMTAKSKTYKARFWMCEDYPLSLKDQLLPIVDLMSEYNPYFHKLKEFLTKQLPVGFPMKVGTKNS